MLFQEVQERKTFGQAPIDANIQNRIKTENVLYILYPFYLSGSASFLDLHCNIGLQF